MVLDPDKPAPGAVATLGSITIDSPAARRVSQAEISLAKADIRACYFEFREALNDVLATLDALAMANVANIRATFDDVYDMQWVRARGDAQKTRSRDEALVGKVLAYKKSVLHITDVVTPGFRISEPRITLMYQFLDGRGGEATPGQPHHVHAAYRTGAAPTRSSRNEPCESAHSADAGEIPTLMRRLVAFCNTDRFSPTVQSAIALALFEAISPFDYHIDHMGRLLARAVLCRRGLIEHLACPLALHASKHRRGHYTLLEASTRTTCGAAPCQSSSWDSSTPTCPRSWRASRSRYGRWMRSRGSSCPGANAWTRHAPIRQCAPSWTSYQDSHGLRWPP